MLGVGPGRAPVEPGVEDGHWVVLVDAAVHEGPVGREAEGEATAAVAHSVAAKD